VVEKWIRGAERIREGVREITVLIWGMWSGI
jgi:hypothetical protein